MSDSQDMHESLSDLCRCVVCKSIQTDARCCANGHLTCGDCLVRYAAICNTPEAVCAVCRSSSNWSQALFARHILEALEADIGEPFLTCDNEGCLETLEVGTLSEHQKTCPHRKVACPQRGCATEVKLKDLSQHLAIHDDVIVTTPGRAMTFCLVGPYSQRVIVITSLDDAAEPAVFHFECTGAQGRSGPFELHQAVIRVCCLTPETKPWTMMVENRAPDDTCRVVETARRAVPSACNVLTCRAIAQLMVTARYTLPLTEELQMHLGDNIHAWWNSYRTRDLRKHIQPIGDAFPEHTDVHPVALFSLKLEHDV